MATIIDSLIVKLGLDSSGFDSEKTKVDKGLKDTGTEVDKVASKFLKFFAAIGGAMAVKRFASDLIESSAALDRLSKNLDTNVASIAAWGNAAELAGGSAEGLQGTLSMFSKAGTEFQLTGDNSLIPYFSALKIAFLDANGNVRAGTDWLLDLSTRMANMPRSKANNMLLAMGIDQGTSNLILSGRKEIELTLARQKEYAAAMAKLAPEGSKLNRMLIEGKQSFALFGIELLTKAAPAIETVFGLFSKFGAWIGENKEFVQTFLTIMTVGLAGIAAAIIPINLTAVAIVALSAAIAALWNDYQTWRKGGDSFFGDDWKLIENGVNRVKKSFGELQDIMTRDANDPDTWYDFLTGNWAPKEPKKNIKNESKPSSSSAPIAKSTSATGSIKEQQARLSALEQKYGLPTGLLDNVWNTESGRGKNMTSHAGAQGHFQFMPATAAQYGLKNPNDFNESSDAAARMYRDLLKANGGDVGKAAAAYNWGQGNLNKKGLGSAPTETLNYIKKVTSGIAGASQSASGAGAGNVAQANAAGGAVSGSRSVETNIGEVKVYSAATDASGIAKDMGKSLDYLFTAQANYGLF